MIDRVHLAEPWNDVLMRTVNGCRCGFANISTHAVILHCNFGLRTVFGTWLWNSIFNLSVADFVAAGLIFS